MLLLLNFAAANVTVVVVAAATAAASGRGTFNVVAEIFAIFSSTDVHVPPAADL